MNEVRLVVLAFGAGFLSGVLLTIAWLQVREIMWKSRIGYPRPTHRSHRHNGRRRTED